jgi:nucleoside-diphosphate-sugar epimerase
MIEGQTVLVTGGLGFIGSALVRRLGERNQVIVFDNGWRRSPEAEAVLRAGTVKFIDGDVLVPDTLQGVLNGCDAVVHMAAIAGVSSYYQMPLRTMEVNLIGTYHVLDAARRAGSRLRRFVTLSTSEIFGPLAWRVGSNSPTQQGEMSDRRWTYAISKLAAEKLAFSFHWQHDLPIVALRPFNIYGPGQTGEGAIQRFATAALNAEPLRITGDGLQIRSWCYITDMIAAIEAALEKHAAVGRAYNIGNPRATITILDLAERVRTLTGSSSPVELVPHIGVDVDLRVPDISQAREDLDFEPRVGLDDGLRTTLDWYAAQQRQASAQFTGAATVGDGA